MRSYRAQSDRISLVLNMDSVFVLIDTAIPCGLLLNELISNALKYAFPGDRKGEVGLRLHQAEDGAITLQISDDGVGVPESFDFRKSDTLGLQTVFGIVEHQLQGEIMVTKGQGITWQIRFRDDLYSPRV